MFGRTFERVKVWGTRKEWRKIKSRIWQVAVIFLGIMLLAACQSNEANVNQAQEQNEDQHEEQNETQNEAQTQEQSQENEESPSSEYQNVESSDGSLRVEVDNDWKSDEELNHRALIALSNRGEEKYFVVRSVSKASMASGATLQDFIQTTNETMQITADHIEVFNETETVINQNPAKQLEIKAEIDSVQLHYLITYAESEQWFYQISLWSLESEFEGHKEEFQSITSNIEFITEPPAEDPESPSPEQSEGQSGEPVKIIGNDGNSEITLPSGWIEMEDLHAEGSIQASRIDATGEHFFVSIAESKQHFSDDITLELYYDLLLDMQASLIQNKQYSEPEYVTIDGNEALQFELTGEVDKVKIGYLFTLIETDESLYQTFFWTRQSELENHAAAYREIIQTFKVMN